MSPQRALPPRCLIISRTDKIGDVVLTLPMAGYLKKNWPNCKIIFLGQSYTRSVIECSPHVDIFWNWSEIKELDDQAARKLCETHNVDAIIHVFPQREIAKWAKRMGIPLRLGTRNRLYHWWTCNSLVGVSRKNSQDHEAELNLSILRGFFAEKFPKRDELAAFYGLKSSKPLAQEFRQLLAKDKINLILHPKSKGSAREWPLENYVELAKRLPEERFKIFVSGGPDEAEELLASFPREVGNRVENIAGRLPLDQFIAFIEAADGLIAASTGPLHIAASLGRHALGLYPPIRPMHGGRWGPLGPHASYLAVDKLCESCRNGSHCFCMDEISVSSVQERIETSFQKLSID